MHIRDLCRDERALLVDFHATLSPKSRYRRFHGAVPTLSDSFLTRLTDVDGDRHVALVAFGDHEGVVGVAHLIRHPDRWHEAEIAVAVADAWHRRGIGRALGSALIGRATALGINRVTGAVLVENTPALRLFRAIFPLCLVRRGDGVLDIEALLGDDQLLHLSMDELLCDLLS